MKALLDKEEFDLDTTIGERNFFIVLTQIYTLEDLADHLGLYTEADLKEEYNSGHSDGYEEGLSDI